MPLVVLDYIAAQLGVADPSNVKHYLDREKMRLDHHWEIKRIDGWSDFRRTAMSCPGGLITGAWTTGAGPKAFEEEVA